jgi:hypothetical protein
MSDERHLPDLTRSPELREAVGRVTMASAEIDQTLTRLLDEIAGVNDHNWILFRGQSTDWLIKSILELLKFGAAPYRSTVDDLAVMQKLVNEISSLQIHRNMVVHGIWSTRPQWGEVDDEDPAWRPRPRLWGDRDEDTILYCHRTRLRRIPPDQKMTVSDVHHLAKLIEDVDQELVAVMQDIRNRPFPDVDEESNN